MVVTPGKNPITEEEAIILLNSFKKIYVARGKRVLEYTSIHDDKEKVIKVAIGRAGNLRSPTVHFEDTIFIGYNINIYKKLIQ